jgi:hypothetical protein
MRKFCEKNRLREGRLYRFGGTLLVAAGLSGCGATTVASDVNFVVAMLGVFEAPEDAAGDSEPTHQTYSLEDVTLTSATGEVVDLYTDDPKDVRILSRSQIIHEEDIGDYEEESFASASVTFAATVTGMGGSGDELTLTLPATTLTYATAFTIPKAKSQRLTIKVQWKNTIGTDEDGAESMTAPTFSLDLDDD